MEGLMRKFIKTAGLAVAFAAMAVSSASATTGPAMLTSTNPIGTGSNTAAVSGNTASFAAHTFTIGGAVVTCGDANFTITSVTTNTATVDPHYTGCSLLVSGTPVGAATVDIACDWTFTFHHATFTDTTGAGTGGTVDTNCNTAVTVPAVNCQINVAAQTRPGISTQNITSTGASTAVAHPWGSKITGNVTGLTYTVPAGKSCPGVAEHGTGNYVGTVAVRNLWGML
jgi:hypothetical protein